MAAERGAFIDQSQSLNLHVAAPTMGKCTTMHFKAWEAGLKTGMYYLRSRPAVEAIKFTVNKLPVAKKLKQEPGAAVADPSNKENNCSADDEGCISCSG